MMETKDYELTPMQIIGLFQTLPMMNGRDITVGEANPQVVMRAYKLGDDARYAIRKNLGILKEEVRVISEIHEGIKGEHTDEFGNENEGKSKAALKEFNKTARPIALYPIPEAQLYEAENDKRGTQIPMSLLTDLEIIIA